MADMQTGTTSIAAPARQREQVSPERIAEEIIGYSDYELLDASSADVAPAAITKCRGIAADTGGIVKIDYTSRTGATVTEVLTLVSGVTRQVRNVTKLYRYYTGTTAGTAKCYNSAGSEKTNAIKLLA